MNTFRRYEKKFLISNTQKAQLIESIKEYMELDKFCINQETYKINNVYFDSKDYYLIHHSVMKPYHKEKVRLRNYGNSKKYFLEAKMKNNKMVYKRRLSMKLEEINDFIITKKISLKDDYLHNQVANEITYLIQEFKLEPRVFISYDRLAFFGKNDSTFRLTFDNNIKARTNDLFTFNNSEGNYLLDNNYCLMEIKVSAKAIPLWLVKEMSKLKIYPCSFSKYGTEYKKIVTEDYESCFTQYLVQY